MALLDMVYWLWIICIDFQFTDTKGNNPNNNNFQRLEYVSCLQELNW